MRNIKKTVLIIHVTTIIDMYIVIRINIERIINQMV